MKQPSQRHKAADQQSSADKEKGRGFLAPLVEVLVVVILVLFLAFLAAPRLEKNTSKPHISNEPHEEVAPPTRAPQPPVTTRKPPDRSPASVVSEDELLEQEVGRLKSGRLAYNTPTKMKTGQTAHVMARIGSDGVSLNTLEAGMPAGNGTTTAEAPTTISTKMKMSLKSADFDITPLSSEEQFVIGNSPTTWEWDIIPKHSGKLSLHLAAVVELNNLAKDFTTVDREIAVQVDPLDAAARFAKENSVWVLTTLGAAIAALWAWRKKRKKSKAPAWENP